MQEIESRDLDPRDGFELRVVLFEDPESSPADADCYSAEDVEAFNRGDWGYVGVVVEASRAGVVLGTGSIWGTEYGQLADVTADPYYAIDAYDLIGEAVENARRVAAAICAEVVPA